MVQRYIFIARYSIFGLEEQGFSGAFYCFQPWFTLSVIGILYSLKSLHILYYFFLSIIAIAAYLLITL